MAKRTAPSVKGSRLPGILRDVLALGLMFGLLLAVYLLPADTSLSEVRSAGRLAVCMPDRYPPLVTGTPDAPGYDVELMREIAGRLGVRLQVNVNPGIGRDFNPRNWRLNRAQCQMIAGGVVLSRNVRSFLDTLPTPLASGWAAVSPQSLETLTGTTAGVFTSLSGLDRIGLSRFLREQGSRARVVQSIDALEKGIQDGTFDLAITEALTASQMAERNDWTVAWMPEPVERYQLGLGFWRGDITLLQAVERILAELEAEGFMDELQEKYELSPIVGTVGEAAE